MEWTREKNRECLFFCLHGLESSGKKDLKIMFLPTILFRIHIFKILYSYLGSPCKRFHKMKIKIIEEVSLWAKETVIRKSAEMPLSREDYLETASGQ